jgi:hypothetical protein
MGKAMGHVVAKDYKVRGVKYWDEIWSLTRLRESEWNDLGMFGTAVR